MFLAEFYTFLFRILIPNFNQWAFKALKKIFLSCISIFLAPYAFYAIIFVKIFSLWLYDILLSNFFFV